MSAASNSQLGQSENQRSSAVFGDGRAACDNGDWAQADLIEFIDSAAIGLHRFGPDGTILWANQAELDLLGYTREEYIGHNISDFHADAPVIEEILARLGRGEVLRNYEARLLRKDGSIRYVLIDCSARFDGGRFMHARSFTRERKVLNEVSSRLAAIVESSDDAIISKDLNGIITSWNQGAQRLFGYTEDEIIGQPVTTLMPPDRVNEEPGILERIRSGERIEHYETIRRAKDGRLLNISLTVSPIVDAQGRIVGASKVARDITDRKRAEETERRAEQLAASAEMAASLAHEINNPLQALTNLVALISHRLADDKNGYGVAGMANKELERITHITKHMLALRRDTRTLSSLSLPEILDDAIESLAPELVAKHIEIERRYDCSRQIEGFPGELRQLFTSLIANSVEARPTKITIRVSCSHNWKSGGESIRVVVADDGTGIAPELVTKIFDPFATSKERRGAGLGLWVAKNIVSRHHGRIRFRTSTRRGKGGTSFAVFFPEIGERIPVRSDSGVSKTAAHERLGLQSPSLHERPSFSSAGS
jgi:PAS domain S-box-containing protein